MQLNSRLSQFLKLPIWLISIGLCLFGLGCTNALATEQLSALRAIIGSQDAILVTDPHGGIIVSKNADKELVPASTLKIFTALVALHYLGPDYRFTTEFYLDEDQNLKVKGHGDPLLISEILVEIAATLRIRLEKVNDIVLDDSYFAQPLTIPGISSSTEPYDAPNGALCVNFNTVNFKKVNGDYISGEPQTPLLAFALDRIKRTKLNEGRIVLSHDDNECTLYAGHLFRYFLRTQGIQTGPDIRIGKVQKATDTLIHTYVSRFSLKDIIAKLLEHSNNYTTNQILIAAGIRAYGPPGTLAKGVQAATSFATDGLQLDSFSIAEGSGISRENRISALDLHKVIEAFEPHRHLMQREGSEFFKTGTLFGISTRVGYIENSQSNVYRYVVLINTPGKSADRAMKLLRITLD
ncbi:MAG: D-alanyl-D-alanine carboxypeptidase [Deltaproteobacteria bacterium]|nr:MAG: D-alanyl-D-alanine carboxypeptidase [Deltaproteobacteria bacterium]